MILNLRYCCVNSYVTYLAQKSVNHGIIVFVDPYQFLVNVNRIKLNFIIGPKLMCFLHIFFLII